MSRVLCNIVIAAVLAALSGCGERADSTKVQATRDPSVLVAVTTPELPPYSYVDKKTGRIEGVDIDIIRNAAKKLGMTADIRATPFADMMPMVKNGDADIAAGGLTITEGRSRNVDFSIPYATGGSAFLYHAGAKVPTMITMEQMRVAVVESMTQDFYLARHGIDPIRFSAIEDAIESLRSNKVDVVAYDMPALRVIVKESGGRLAVTPLETRELYGIAVSKSRPDILAAVNEAVEDRRRAK